MLEDNDVTADSSQQDVNSDSSTDWNSGDKFVPYSRFKEVNDQMKNYKESSENLESRLKSIESRFAPPAPAQSTIPDMFEDPMAYAQWVKQETLKEIDARENTKLELSAREKAEINQLLEKNPKLDLDKLKQHKDKYEFKSLKIAYENMQEFSKAEESGKNSAQANFARAKSSPVWTSSSTRDPMANLTQQDLRSLKTSGSLAWFLASQWK